MVTVNVSRTDQHLIYGSGWPLQVKVKSNRRYSRAWLAKVKGTDDLLNLTVEREYLKPVEQKYGVKVFLATEPGIYDLNTLNGRKEGGFGEHLFLRVESDGSVDIIFEKHGLALIFGYDNFHSLKEARYHSVLAHDSIAGLPTLIGSTDQVLWAAPWRIAAFAELTARFSAESVVEAFRKAPDARFWIENRRGGELLLQYLQEL
ncbi:hypothetical protein [Geotalea sp. SG265]|uniref:hypothetical protein n=1 Tax=Geotalea sp. SG265 TaxID=2922867 RepID=UPI001FAEF5D3|nr:hypothetical protein [Geotalea sp. SG265]